jgi:hypothetical protein
MLHRRRHDDHRQQDAESHRRPATSGQEAASGSWQDRTNRRERFRASAVQEVGRGGEIEIVDDGREATAAGAGGKAVRHFMPGHGSNVIRRGGDR